ncbi:MAG TPA: hypothetical protein RMH99_23990 [Sandaracinaceae bacterium LLY-WYZ-13_1]|nr:hypothetical protein [Sandaracinaceae bacterium LLY-WYZ-13_1]
MSERDRSGGGKGGEPKVLRRRAEQRERLPEDIEAFASGDDDALWRRPARRRLRDPRPVQLVPGVANRDARAVCEARERRLREALEARDDDRLAVELAEAACLRVWRGRSIVAWDAFVENVLGMDRAEAERLAARGAERVGSAEPASDEVVATWMRAEAGALEGCGPDVAVRLRGERLVIDLPVAEAPAALSQIGRRATPLAREQAEAPKTVVDRPKGVPRISRLIERDMRGDD